MKTVYINLWDDYHQKPEHQWNDTTFLQIEGTHDRNDRLPDYDVLEIREGLLTECLKWRRGSLVRFMGAIRFSRSFHDDSLDIIELDTQSRESLYKYLKEHFKEFIGYKIQMTMES